VTDSRLFPDVPFGSTTAVGECRAPWPVVFTVFLGLHSQTFLPAPPVTPLVMAVPSFSCHPSYQGSSGVSLPASPSLSVLSSSAPKRAQARLVGVFPPPRFSILFPPIGLSFSFVGTGALADHRPPCPVPLTRIGSSRTPFRRLQADPLPKCIDPRPFPLRPFFSLTPMQVSPLLFKVTWPLVRVKVISLAGGPLVFPSFSL